MANEKILIVDDERFNWDMLSRRLKRLGYEVAVATNGPEAIEAVNKAAADGVPFDMVLLDVMMPDMDGFEVLTVIRRSFDASELPVIMATALSDSSDILKALTAGANDYVTKPINVEILDARMKSRFPKREPKAFKAAEGVKMGRYELKKCLGEGATSEVYLAWDANLKREVAIKILKNSFELNEEALERFTREAKSVAGINHPGVVGIYEIGTKPCHFLAIEYIKGHNLAEVVGKDVFTVKAAADVAWQIADILSAVHAAGIVHRDLKPQNLIMDDEGRVHLIDFGLAKSVAGDSGLTKAGAVLGTPRYISPEQLDATLGSISPASDIFPLGLMLYEMLTGEPALRGDSFQALSYDVLFRKPASPAEKNPEVPKALDDLCLRMQATNPADRVSSAAEICRILEPLRS